MPSVARLVSNEGEGDEGGRAVFSIVVDDDDTRVNLSLIRRIKSSVFSVAFLVGGECER